MDKNINHIINEEITQDFDEFLHNNYIKESEWKSKYRNKFVTVYKNIISKLESYDKTLPSNNIIDYPDKDPEDWPSKELIKFMDNYKGGPNDRKDGICTKSLVVCEYNEKNAPLLKRKSIIENLDKIIYGCIPSDLQNKSEKMYFWIQKTSSKYILIANSIIMNESCDPYEGGNVKVNKINTLANIARNYGITESGNLRDDIVSEYTEILESLDNIDESVINRDISLLPVYKINEETCINEGLISNFIKRQHQKIKYNIVINRSKKNNVGKTETVEAAFRIYEENNPKLVKFKDTDIETLNINNTTNKEVLKLMHEYSAYYVTLVSYNSKPIIMILITDDYRIATVFAWEEYNEHCDYYVYYNCYDTGSEISPEMYKWAKNIVDNNKIDESFVEPVNEVFSADYNGVMGYNVGFVQRKMMPLSWVRRSRENLYNTREKYEADLKKFKKMSDEEQEDFCAKINAGNAAYSAGMAIATTMATSYATDGNYSLTYIELPAKITPYNYPGIVERMIKKLDYDIKKLDQIARKKEIAKGIRQEGYAIDLDSLKSVVESKEISLEEAIQEIRDVNYIGNTIPMYCVLPENINENMTLESFIELNDILHEAEIIPMCVREYDIADWKIKGDK